MGSCLYHSSIFPEIIFRYSDAKIEGKLDRNGRFNPSLNFLACLVLFS